MNVLTVPKKAAALEYSLLRLPATLVESQVVVRFLDDDSALRLGFERALGTLDEKAGRLLGDQALTARGTALRRRSEVLADAVRLEDQAAQRRAQATAELQDEQAAVAAERRDAERTRAQGVQEAAAAERAAKQRSAAATKAQAQAEKRRIAAQAKAAVDAAQKKADAAEARIDAAERAVTAAPEAQLEQAAQQLVAADDARDRADTLSDLADVEKARRSS